MTISAGAATDPGLTRATNEDRIYCDAERCVFLVVDGLGGHVAGERAAQTAVDVISSELQAGGGDTEAQIRRAIALANNEIYRLGQEQPACAGMGCVLTLAVIRDGRVTLGHVGDSRLYLIWNGHVRKLTSDHSPVGEQEDLGEMTESEAMFHPRRNEVFRDLGARWHEPDDEDFIEVRSFTYQPSAALLLCSDGLSDALTSTEIGAIVERYDGDANQTARDLVEAAKERGGSDNISVVFVPGPEFIGANSGAAVAARRRQAITRMRTNRKRWQRRFRHAVWLLIGMVLGLVLWHLFAAVAGGWTTLAGVWQ
jgi:serine/threonine protein phosphatase PrpC